MSNRVEEVQDKFFDELLQSIKPSNEEVIERRIHHIPFAKIVIWLCLESRKKFVFDKKELRKFTGLTNSRVQEILNDFISAGLIQKGFGSSGKTYYTFIKEKISGDMIIRKYFNVALKTLGKKPKKEISFKIEQEIDEGDYF